MDRAYEHRRRYTAVNIAVDFVGTFLVGGEGGDVSGICRLNDGVKVECWRGLTVVVVTEVGKVESRTAVHPADAGHKLADFSLEIHRVDVNQRSRTPINKSNAVSNDIVGTGEAGWRCCLKGIT